MRTRGGAVAGTVSSTVPSAPARTARGSAPVRRPPGRPSSTRPGSTDVGARPGAPKRGRSVPEEPTVAAPASEPVVPALEETPEARADGSRAAEAESRAERDARFERD